MKRFILYLGLLFPMLVKGQDSSAVKSLNIKIQENIKFMKDKRSQIEVQDMDLQLLAPAMRKQISDFDKAKLQENQELKEMIIKKAQKIYVESKSESEIIRKKNTLSGPSQFDSRVELRQLNPFIPWQNSILNNATGVGLLVPRASLNRLNDTLFSISTMSLKEKYGLCPAEAFAEQPVAGEATVFLIDSISVMTAGHAIAQKPEDYCVVFGFELLSKQGVFSNYINTKDVYDISALTFKDDELDLAIVKLARPSKRKPLVISSNFSYLADREVYMIGYPCGLPQKVALNAEILKSPENIHFYTSLDAFQGNSGSPVFSKETNEVIGILVSGMMDFDWTGSCNTVSTCRYPYCFGEAVLRSDLICSVIRGFLVRE